eukprot:4807-Heterococcus_DN1.PRE.4
MQELHSCETICAARNKERNAYIAAAVVNGSIGHCCDTLLCHFTISTTTATLQLQVVARLLPPLLLEMAPHTDSSNVDSSANGSADTGDTATERSTKH